MYTHTDHTMLRLDRRYNTVSGIYSQARSKQNSEEKKSILKL